MMKAKKGYHALIVALVMAIFCSFIAFGDEVAAPAEYAVESVMDDAADDSSVSEPTDSEMDTDADSDSEPDGSEAEDVSEPEEKKDDDQSSFDSGNKEDHSSFDEWDFPEPAPQPEPVTPVTPEPEKPEPVTPVTPEPEKPEPEKPEPETPVTPEPEKPVTPEHWDDDDDDDDIVVVTSEKPVVTETEEVPVITVFEAPTGNALPETEKPVVKIPETPGSALPKTGDSNLPLYAFMASAFGLALLIGSSFIGSCNADETANKKQTSAHPQMCCELQEARKSGKSVSVKAVRSSRIKSAPSRFGLRHKNCIKIVLALTHPGGGFLCLKSSES